MFPRNLRFRVNSEMVWLDETAALETPSFSGSVKNGLLAESFSCNHMRTFGSPWYQTTDQPQNLLDSRFQVDTHDWIV